jgi:hypothetical protein
MGKDSACPDPFVIFFIARKDETYFLNLTSAKPVFPCLNLQLWISKILSRFYALH